jgi:hypothetical protein
METINYGRNKFYDTGPRSQYYKTFFIVIYATSGIFPCDFSSDYADSGVIPLKKSFLILGPGVIIIKLFFNVIYSTRGIFPYGIYSEYADSGVNYAEKSFVTWVRGVNSIKLFPLLVTIL